MFPTITRPLTLIQPVNRHKNSEMMNTQAKQTKPTRNRSVGSRVSDRDFETIQKWSKAEGMNTSGWLMKTVHIYTKMKNDKQILLSALKKSLKDPELLFNFQRRKKVEEMMEFLIHL